jgi:hypothetical protein
LNYWVGAGGAGHGGYTNIFSGSAGNWTLRPAASDLANFFLLEEHTYPSVIPTVLSSLTDAQNTVATPSVGITCVSLVHLSVNHFCDRSNPKEPITRATFTWNAVSIMPGSSYTIVYGRVGKNPSSKSTTATTLTIPRSDEYGLYSDGSTYTVHVEYATALCKNQKTPHTQFIPTDCHH